MMIVRPVTDDGLVGYDKFDQLLVETPRGNYTEARFIHDVRNLTCPVCARGWDATGPSMSDQVVWDLVDAPAHESCVQRHYGLVERQDFTNVLVGARVRFRGLRPIPNRYWPDAYAESKKPWYEAELIDHAARFVLGWRKRVAHVEIIAEGGKQFSWWEAAQEAFASENVTKTIGPWSIILHAWSEAKVQEYVRKLVELGRLSVQREPASGARP